MSEVLNEEWQRHVASSVCHWAERAGINASESSQKAADEQTRPSVLFRPRLSIDGNQWCALYGENLQDGCAGFGDSPDAAMRHFDLNWSRKLPHGA